MTDAEREQARAFGDWLRLELDRRGWSMRYASGQMGIGHTTFQEYMRGKFLPKDSNLLQIAEGLGVPPGVVYQAAGRRDPGEVIGGSPERLRLRQLVDEMPEARVPYALVAVEAVLRVQDPSPAAALSFEGPSISDESSAASDDPGRKT